MPAPFHTRASELRIWFYAFGYFAAYAPYSALTKALSKGLFEGDGRRHIGSFEMLPLSAGASTVAMFVFLTAMGWWRHTASIVLMTTLVGLLSQGTGVFGGLILLDPRENTYTVPVNRSSSILAGLAASYGLRLWFDQRPPSKGELVGAMLIVLAILFLTVGPMIEKRRAARRDGEGSAAIAGLLVLARLVWRRRSRSQPTV